MLNTVYSFHLNLVPKVGMYYVVGHIVCADLCDTSAVVANNNCGGNNT